MAATNDNPQVAQIRQSVYSSYTRIQQLLDGPLSTLDTEKLYQTPEPDEWSLMENVAHIIEVMPYWGDEIAKPVAAPGQNFGRTHQHEGRLRAIAEHGKDNLAQAKAALPGSYEHLDRILSTLKDSDLTIQGHHAKYGDRDLAWFIKEFVTQHLESHIDQIERALSALNNK